MHCIDLRHYTNRPQDLKTTRLRLTETDRTEHTHSLTHTHTHTHTQRKKKQNKKKTKKTKQTTKTTRTTTITKKPVRTKYHRQTVSQERYMFQTADAIQSSQTCHFPSHSGSAPADMWLHTELCLHYIIQPSHASCRHPPMGGGKVVVVRGGGGVGQWRDGCGCPRCLISKPRLSFRTHQCLISHRHASSLSQFCDRF